MVSGKRLKKSNGGELEVNKQNVAALDEAIFRNATLGQV